MKIAIASRNPAKINAVKMAFEQIFPESRLDYTGYAVQSGVADQPRTIGETWRGAVNRLEALEKVAADHTYFVAIEGGIQDDSGTMYAYACIVVSDGQRTGRSMTGQFVLPDAVAKLVRAGEELGVADDIVFSRHDSKRNNGAVGLLTGDVITRTTLYEHALILAMIPFIKPELYPQSDQKG